MTIVGGVDTIVGLVGEPPPEIPIKHKTMSKQQILMMDWNKSFVAIIPYCFKCKVPLAWHFDPREEGHEDELFTCPSCGRVWVKDSKDDRWPKHKTTKDNKLEQQVSKEYDKWKETI